MKRLADHRAFAPVFVSLSWFVGFTHGQTSGGQDLARSFDYDRIASLDQQENSVADRHGVQVRDITYASPKGGRVPAYLVEPRGKGPFAGIVFVHSGQWDRREFLAEAQLLAKAGAVSVLIDAPFMRPKHWKKASDDMEGYIQLVVDCRRAVDLLVSRPNVDAKRIAYVGHSLGATWGGAIAVSERRLKALVLMAGFSEFSTSMRAILPPEQLQKYEFQLKMVARFDADRLLGQAAPTAILFQFAQYDKFISHEDAQKSVQSASEPKIVKWYEGGHEFADVRALPDRADFLRQQIGIAPVRPIILQELGWESHKP